MNRLKEVREVANGCSKCQVEGTVEQRPKEGRVGESGNSLKVSGEGSNHAGLEGPLRTLTFTLSARGIFQGLEPEEGKVELPGY